MIRRTVAVSVGLTISVFFLFVERSNAQAQYTLKPKAKTVAWGYDAKAAQQAVASTGAPKEKQPIIYVRHLMPPRAYPLLARQTRLGGTILIRLTIAADGTVLSTKSSPGDSETRGFLILRDDAEELVKKWTFGCAGCPPNAPFEHTIKFNYRLDSEDVLPDNWIIFDLPDEVTITASPPVCDHCPSPKPSKKGNH